MATDTCVVPSVHKAPGEYSAPGQCPQLTGRAALASQPPGGHLALALANQGFSDLTCHSFSPRMEAHEDRDSSVCFTAVSPAPTVK